MERIFKRVQVQLAVIAVYTMTPTDFDGAIWMLSPLREYVPLKTRVFMDYLIEPFQHGHS